MKHRGCRGVVLAAWLAATCAIAPVRADERLERQVEQFKEQVEARRRDAKARCDGGDKKACSEAICLRLMTDGPSAERYRDCARSQGFQTSARWAQFSELRTSNRTQLSVDIVCLADPESLKLGGKEVKVFRQFRLQADTGHATAFHDRGRFHVNMLGGPDYATWEEGAEAECATRAPTR
jgi:hypothetical protein